MNETIQPKRSISASTLLFTSVSAILGSGWLFAAYYSALLAGPASLIAWVIGGAALTLIAFVFAELCAMLPLTGSSTRIPQYTHGTVVNFVFSWFIWLSYASFVPAEVQAILQYLNYFIPNILTANAALTGVGYFYATGFMLLASAINIFSLRWLLRCNTALTIIKLIIPCVLSVAILLYAIYPPVILKSTFMPFGWHGVFAALTTGGIAFAFNGFKQACEMAGESKNPQRFLPVAIIGSIIICLVVYLLLEVAFLVGLQPVNLLAGWNAFHLPHSDSPLMSLLIQNKLPVLIPFLYIGAVIAPLAAALMYTGSSSRSLYGMSLNHQMPAIFKKLSPAGNPIAAIMATFVFSLLFFLPLPGWKRMVAFLTSLMSISYAVGPVCLLSLRQQLPHYPRPFKLPYVHVWGIFSFYICTLLTYWNGWFIISKLGLAILLGLALLFIQYLNSMRLKNRMNLDLRSSIWLWVYLIGITLISYLGNFEGGKNVISFGWDFLVIAIFCSVVLWLSLRFKLPSDQTQAAIHESMDNTTEERQDSFVKVTKSPH